MKKSHCHAAKAVREAESAYAVDYTLTENRVKEKIFLDLYYS
jgi:hypothetical protein